MKPIKDKKMIGLTLTVLAILLLAIMALCIQTRSVPENKAEVKTAAIYQNGKLLHRIPLTEDTEDTFTIEDNDGGYNTIQISNGKIGIIDADCPDRLCVKMGMVSSSAYPISCLPHKLVIQIEDDTDITDDKEEPPIDAVTR